MDLFFTFLLQPAHTVSRIRKKTTVKGEARPVVLGVPVHVQNEHIQRNGPRLVVLNNLAHVEIVDIVPPICII
jgi:hypothetical protein